MLVNSLAPRAFDGLTIRRRADTRDGCRPTSLGLQQASPLVTLGIFWSVVRAIGVRLVLQMRVLLESPPDGALCSRLVSLLKRSPGVRLASLGTKVRAAEADIPYADSARRATLVIVGGHVVRHRR